MARLRAKKAGPADELSVVEHLDELRTRIIVSASVLVVAVGLCFWQNGLILEIANGPLPGDKEPITFSPTEPFFTTMKLSFYAGILLGIIIEWSTFFVDSGLKLAVGFVVLILVLVIRPQGILGKARAV